MQKAIMQCPKILKNMYLQSSSTSNLPVTCEGKIKTLSDISCQFPWTTCLEITGACTPPKWNQKHNETREMGNRSSHTGGEKCWKSLDEEEEALGDSSAPGVEEKAGPP